MTPLEVKENKVGLGKSERIIRYLFFPCPYDKACRRCYLDETGCFYHWSPRPGVCLGYRPRRPPMLRAEITRIIAEAVTDRQPPWRQPWRRRTSVPSLPHNFHSRRPYKGINILLLLEAAGRFGWRSPVWGTERQWAGVGAQIKTPPAHIPVSDWGSRIVFYAEMSRPNGKTGLVMRTYTVYNLDQVEGGRSQQFASLTAQFASWEPAESLLRATGADIRHGGDEAFYDEREDYIQLPEPDDFDSEADYYETAFHEAVHWAQREGRVRKHAHYRDDYPFNELVSEIGACFLALETHVPFARKLLPESAKYIRSWLAGMEGDSRYIFAASSQASKVVDYLKKDWTCRSTPSISSRTAHGPVLSLATT